MIDDDGEMPADCISGDIYGASLDQALWPDAVNRIRTFVGARTASLVSQDAVTLVDFFSTLEKSSRGCAAGYPALRPRIASSHQGQMPEANR